jgi:hypothetical protein
MALVDELREYIRQNGDTKTKISEPHSVAIIGETHAPLLSGDKAAIRTATSSRVILELLLDPIYRYFASEHFFNSGPIRRGVRAALRHGTLPPPLDDPTAFSLDDPNIESIANRVLVPRHQLILDFLRRNSRYVLCLGTAVSTGRDWLLAKNFLEEAADRKLTVGVRGVVQLGANHALAVPDDNQPTTRMILAKHGYRCISIRALSDFVPQSGTPDDLVVSVDAPLDNITQGDIIRLTSLVDKTPVTIPTKRGNSSPFRKVTFGSSKRSVAEQFEYILLQKS